MKARYLITTYVLVAGITAGQVADRIKREFPDEYTRPGNSAEAVFIASIGWPIYWPAKVTFDLLQEDE